MYSQHARTYPVTVNSSMVQCMPYSYVDEHEVNGLLTTTGTT